MASYGLASGSHIGCSKALLLLWILLLAMFHVCLCYAAIEPFCHLLGKDWPLCFLVCCVCPPVIVLLNVPRRSFFVDLFVICVSCLFLSYCLVFLLQPCGHILGKGWPLDSFVCDVFLCFCHFHIWCPGSVMILNSIDSWYFPSSLLSCGFVTFQYYFDSHQD